MSFMKFYTKNYLVIINSKVVLNIIKVGKRKLNTRERSPFYFYVDHTILNVLFWEGKTSAVSGYHFWKYIEVKVTRQKSICSFLVS